MELTLPNPGAFPARPMAASLGAYTVDEIQGHAGFAALREAWDETLARGPVDQPFQRHAYLTAWLQAFAPDAKLRVLVARDAAGRPAGMAPFIETRRPGLVTLEAPANDHSSRFEWTLGEDPQGAVAAIWAHLRDRLRWDVLTLRDVPRDGPTSTYLEQAAQRDRHPAGRWESLLTPYLTLGGGPGASSPGYEDRLSSKFLANLRRRARKLQEMGAVSYRSIGPGRWRDAEVETFLEQFTALEAKGWKGAGGTAIAHHGPTLAFYRGLAQAANREGWLALRALDLDGRPVAMHFGLCYRGVYSLPKPTYDEGLGACSPGQLLFREVVAECGAHRRSELDFLGPDMPWKRDWEPQLRPHDWLQIYRPGLTGLALHAIRYRLKPVAKEVLSWWRR